MTLFIAASNTISNTLAWALYEVATRPEVEARLHAEVDEVLGGRPAELADVTSLDYTRRVIAETLRMRTQGVFLTKVTSKPADLGGYAIPGGATVIYSFHALNHNSLIHPEPKRFDPDRYPIARPGSRRGRSCRSPSAFTAASVSTSRGPRW
jgi:pentalenene oxygenase